MTLRAAGLYTFDLCMALNGNRFKLSDRSKPCPECHGYPGLKLRDGRLVPECVTCGGDGYVPRDPPSLPAV